jgi:cysteine-rich repeat protein
VADSGEECDDGDTDDTNSCIAGCRAAVCGDGLLWTDREECDEGSANSDSLPDACRTDCREARCGDRVVDSDEACDDGNVASGDGCRADCAKVEACGDGILDSGEECDDGEANSDVEPGACRTTCLDAHCGDSVIDPGEACDDGNATSGDGCRSDCGKIEICGDGTVDAGEACDDGNVVNGDGCNPTCALQGRLSAVAGRFGGQGNLDEHGWATFRQPTGIAETSSYWFVVDDVELRRLTHTPWGPEIRTLYPDSGWLVREDQAAAPSGTFAGVAAAGTDVYSVRNPYDACQVVRIDPETGAVRGLATLPTCPFDISDLAADASYVYVSGSPRPSGAGRLFRVAPGTGGLEAFGGSPGSWCSSTMWSHGDVSGLATSPDEPNLLLASTSRHVIVAIQGCSVNVIAGSLDVAGFADGTGSSARFSDPHGLSRYYVADTGNHAIRTLGWSSGSPATVGTASATGGTCGFGLGHSHSTSPDQFCRPQDLTDEPVIADTGNHLVRERSGGYVIAGWPRLVDGTDGTAASFGIPIALAASETYVYVADLWTQTIRRVDPVTREVMTLAGAFRAEGDSDGPGEDARFRLGGSSGRPTSIALWGGWLWVPDSGNHTIRRVDLVSGETTTFAGLAGEPGATDGSGSTARFYAPAAVASMGGYLYVADWANCTLRRLDPDTAQVVTVAGAAGRCGEADGTGTDALLEHPGVLAAADPVIYFTYEGYVSVRSFDTVTREVRTVVPWASAGPGHCADRDVAEGFVSEIAYGMVFFRGSLYLAGFGCSAIREIDLDTGRISTLVGRAWLWGAVDGTAPDAFMNYPGGITVAPDGNSLIVGEWGEGLIRSVH